MKYNLKDITNQILLGDTRQELKKIPDGCIDLVFTSPPYYRARNYGTEYQVWGGDPSCQHEFGDEITQHLRGDSSNANVGNNKEDYGGKLKKIGLGQFCRKCNAWLGELGREPDHNMFIDHLIEIFREVVRVVKPDGSIYVNLGDTYNGSGGCHKSHHKNDSGFQGKLDPLKAGDGVSLKSYPKQCLFMVPTRFAECMVDELGLVLHNVIIWHKENCLPFSGKSRFTVDWEYIFFFTKKSGKYHFEQQFESLKIESLKRKRRGVSEKNKYAKDKHLPDGVHPNTMSQPRENIGYDGIEEEYKKHAGRNMRSIWTVNTKPNREEHYASFPPELVQRAVSASCPLWICNKCGKPMIRIIEDGEYIPKGGGRSTKYKESELNLSPTSCLLNNKLKSKKFVGYSDCGCNVGFHPGICLDPFCGSGTTPLVAKKMGRYYIGIDLKDEYAQMSRRRIFRETEDIGEWI